MDPRRAFSEDDDSDDGSVTDPFYRFRVVYIGKLSEKLAVDKLMLTVRMQIWMTFTGDTRLADQSIIESCERRRQPFHISHIAKGRPTRLSGQ